MLGKVIIVGFLLLLFVGLFGFIYSLLFKAKQKENSWVLNLMKVAGVWGILKRISGL